MKFHYVRLGLFTLSILLLSWLGMMALHEFGHILGALATGGTVAHVVLHPLAISRTDVTPNPSPLVVVWCGPVIGSLLPLILPWIPGLPILLSNVLKFMAGFCLIANGAYISIGSFDGTGDCGQMMQHGSPMWVLLGFGVLTIPAGLIIWHRLGSPRQLLTEPSVPSNRATVTAFAAASVLTALECSLSSL